MKRKSRLNLIPFVDNKGIVRLRLKPTMTIGQMVRHGMILFIEDANAPIPDGVVVHKPTPIARHEA